MTEPGITIGAKVNSPPVDRHEKRLSSSRSYIETPEVLSTPSLGTQPLQPEDYDPSVGAKPCSPFYRHATFNNSVQQLALEAKHSNRDGCSLNLKDMESGHLAAPSPLPSPSLNPSTDALNGRQSKLWVEKRRRKNCLQAMPKRQRLAVKLAIAALVVGTMVAIALGITAAVGGGVWKSRHQTGPIRR